MLLVGAALLLTIAALLPSVVSDLSEDSGGGRHTARLSLSVGIHSGLANKSA